MQPEGLKLELKWGLPPEWSDPLWDYLQRVRDAERKVDQDAAQSNATHRQLDDAEAAMQAAVAHKDEAAIRAARAQLVRPPPTTPVPCKQTPS